MSAGALQQASTGSLRMGSRGSIRANSATNSECCCGCAHGCASGFDSGTVELAVDSDITVCTGCRTVALTGGGQSANLTTATLPAGYSKCLPMISSSSSACDWAALDAPSQIDGTVYSAGSCAGNSCTERHLDVSVSTSNTLWVARIFVRLGIVPGDNTLCTAPLSFAGANLTLFLQTGARSGSDPCFPSTPISNALTVCHHGGNNNNFGTGGSVTLAFGCLP